MESRRVKVKCSKTDLFKNLQIISIVDFRLYKLDNSLLSFHFAIFTFGANLGLASVSFFLGWNIVL